MAAEQKQNNGDSLYSTVINDGSMVADVHRELCQGGLFMCPGTATKPKGKLRLITNPARFYCRSDRCGAYGWKIPYLDIGTHRTASRAPHW